jgi:hypothetical protein
VISTFENELHASLTRQKIRSTWILFSFTAHKLDLWVPRSNRQRSPEGKGSPFKIGLALRANMPKWARYPVAKGTPPDWPLLRISEPTLHVPVPPDLLDIATASARRKRKAASYQDGASRQNEELFAQDCKFADLVRISSKAEMLSNLIISIICTPPLGRIDNVALKRWALLTVEYIHRNFFLLPVPTFPARTRASWAPASTF